MIDCKHDWHFVQGLTERLRCTRCGLMTWPKDADEKVQEMLADALTTGTGMLRVSSEGVERIDPATIYARPIDDLEVAYGVMMAKAESRIAELQHALEWISRRCPAQFLEQEPHRIHWEAAYDAGACARAALDRAGGAP